MKPGRHIRCYCWGKTGHLMDQNSLKIVGPWEDPTGGRVAHWNLVLARSQPGLSQHTKDVRMTVLAQDRMPALFPC